MKNLIQFVSFCLITFLLAGCQTEDLSEISISDRAKSWYDQNHNLQLNENPNFYGKPDWNRYFQVDDEIYFPLILINKTKSNQRKLDKIENKIFSKSFLILKNTKEGFQESLKVFLTKNENNFNNIEQTLTLSYLLYTYDSNSNISSKSSVFYQTKGEKINRAIANTSNDYGISQKSSNCQTYYVVLTTVYTDGSVDRDILYSYNICGEGAEGGAVGSSTNGGGGSNGDGDPLIGDDGENLSPLPFIADCRSFEYANVFGVNVASTTGINESFHVDHQVPNGIIRRSVELDIAIATFTAPSFLRPGQAANLTAAAISSANINTQQWFLQHTNASPLQLRIQWEIHLKEAMRGMGGSIDIGHNTYEIRSPAPYLITAFPISCD